MMSGIVPSKLKQSHRMLLMSWMKRMYPSTADDIAVFAEKQKFLYAVLESKVLTDRGKAIIRDHEHDFDAQKAYIKD